MVSRLRARTLSICVFLLSLTSRNVMNGLKERKVVTAITGKRRNVILVTPPLCFTMENSRT